MAASENGLFFVHEFKSIYTEYTIEMIVPEGYVARQLPSDVRKRRPVSCPVSAIRARSAAKYGYSQPGLLKPFLDASAGLDKWPAQNSHGTPPLALNLTRDRHLIVVNEESAGKTQTVPKPRLLNSLESYMKKELQKLGVSDTEPSDLRLQVFREVFDLLIRDFRTYQPLLSAIKCQYEMMLAHHRQELRTLAPLKQMLVTVTEQCDLKVMRLKEQENRENQQLRRDNDSLRSELGAMRTAQLQLEAQVERLHQEVQLQYRALRDETDARKLLVVKLNDYHMAQEDALMASQSYTEGATEDEMNDPITLNMALKCARVREKQLTDDVERLEQEIAAYVDVVPVIDHERLKQQHKALNVDLLDVKAESTKLGKDYDALYEKFAEMRAERDQLQKELDQLRSKSLTPRPDWDKCADYLQGGLIRWKQLSRGRHSDDLVTVLLKEFTKKGDGDTAAFEVAEAQNDEGVMLMACQLAMRLVKHDTETEKNGLIKKKDFTSVLHDLFPNKDEELLTSLLKCADIQLDTHPYDVLPYASLFSETKSCKLGAFLDELIVQYYRERREYIEDIWEELSKTDPVSVEDLTRALTIIDPEITTPDVDKYVCFAFNATDSEALGDAKPIRLDLLLNRLQRGMLRRIGKMM